MLAHICDEEYHPFSRTIACLCTLLVHVMIQLKWHRDGTVAWPRDGEDMLLLEAFLLLLVSYVHMVYSMVHAPPYNSKRARFAPHRLSLRHRGCIIRAALMNNEGHGRRDGALAMTRRATHS